MPSAQVSVFRNLRFTTTRQAQLNSQQLLLRPKCSIDFRRHDSSSSRSATNRRARMIPRSHASKPTTTHQPASQPPPAAAQPPERRQEQPTNQLSSLNILGSVPPPTTAIEACLGDGFQLDNGVRISHGDGALLIGGEAFAWRPWETASSFPVSGNNDKMKRLVNERGQFEVDALAWGLLSIVWPRPGECVQHSVI